jgi:hypothetical protein
MDKFVFMLNGKRKYINFIACENPQQDLLCDGNRVIMSGKSIKRFRDWLNKIDNWDLIHYGK